MLSGPYSIHTHTQRERRNEDGWKLCNRNWKSRVKYVEFVVPCTLFVLLVSLYYPGISRLLEEDVAIMLWAAAVATTTKNDDVLMKSGKEKKKYGMRFKLERRRWKLEIDWSKQYSFFCKMERWMDGWMNRSSDRSTVVRFPFGLSSCTRRKYSRNRPTFFFLTYLAILFVVVVCVCLWNEKHQQSSALVCVLPKKRLGWGWVDCCI